MECIDYDPINIYGHIPSDTSTQMVLVLAASEENYHEGADTQRLFIWKLRRFNGSNQKQPSAFTSASESNQFSGQSKQSK